MPSKVTLKVTQGPFAGENFIFEEHDTLVAGRNKASKILFPDSDLTVSRAHFIIEIIPPKAIIKDLGSKNGTYVNGVKYGGREADETPEEGAQREYPQVELKDGDEIRIGKTHMIISIETPVICVACGEEIPEADLAEALMDDGSYLCNNCQQKQAKTVDDWSPPPVIICLNCSKDVTQEAGPYVTGGYLCMECRKLANEQVIDPMEVLQAMFKEARMEQDAGLDIPDYEMIKKLGRGGMGAVYLVRNKKTGEKSALKIMLPKAELVLKQKILFKREKHTMQLFDHPHIVKFFDAGKVGGILYYVMEFCEGGSAGDLADDNGGKLDLETASRIMLQALEGLAHAHQLGYVHRDLKPPNILLTSKDQDGIAKIADMGLAKDYTQAGHSGITGKEYSGTIPFMPREQVSDFKFCKPVSDVWAMGATFYNLLTGQFPRKFTKDTDYLTCILNNPVIPIEKVNYSIPPAVANIIGISLEDDITKRYQNAAEFQQALERVL
jgi:tRNA A-37 threonylcarbamoyl transferase component Bud32/RNA polymerase-binding transcription factor DksA